MKIIKKIINLIKEYYKFILITVLVYLLIEIFNGTIPIVLAFLPVIICKFLCLL